MATKTPLMLSSALAAALLTAAPVPVQADAGVTAAIVGAAFAGLIVGSTVEHEAHLNHRPAYYYYPAAYPVGYPVAYAAPSTLAKVAPVAVTHVPPTVTYAAPVIQFIPPTVTYLPGVVIQK
ncbi:MAG: hypothetical protein HQM00_04440 [Magnetococcales bacterium]|nr:hypothetical protein [Magnetococcales bacterium]